MTISHIPPGANLAFFPDSARFDQHEAEVHMACRTNENLVMRFIREVVNQGDTGAIGDLVANDHVLHSMDGELYGPEGVRLAIFEYRTGFPDLDVDVKELTAEGNWVARTFVMRGTHTGPYFGIPGCGRRIEVQGIGVHRCSGGRLIESWMCLDAAGMIRLMGGDSRS